LGAAFKPKDATLFSVISSFDGAYSAYNAFQNGIERFWTLRWLEQNAVTELEATVMKDGLVRADTLPLVLRATGTESLPRGVRVKVRITGCDLLTLDVWGALVARLDEAAGGVAAEEADEDEESPAAGPLSLAIDLAEPGAGTDGTAQGQGTGGAPTHTAAAA
jgi:exoribonuclease-2